jgi:hypothetical protein
MYFVNLMSRVNKFVIDSALSCLEPKEEKDWNLLVYGDNEWVRVQRRAYISQIHHLVVGTSNLLVIIWPTE